MCMRLSIRAKQKCKRDAERFNLITYMYNFCGTYLLMLIFVLFMQISTSILDIENKSAILSVTSSLKPITYNKYRVMINYLYACKKKFK